MDVNEGWGINIDLSPHEIDALVCFKSGLTQLQNVPNSHLLIQFILVY